MIRSARHVIVNDFAEAAERVGLARRRHRRRRRRGACRLGRRRVGCLLSIWTAAAPPTATARRSAARRHGSTFARAHETGRRRRAGAPSTPAAPLAAALAAALPGWRRSPSPTVRPRRHAHHVRVAGRWHTAHPMHRRRAESRVRPWARRHALELRVHRRTAHRAPVHWARAAHRTAHRAAHRATHRTRAAGRSTGWAWPHPVEPRRPAREAMLWRISRRLARAIRRRQVLGLWSGQNARDARHVVDRMPTHSTVPRPLDLVPHQLGHAGWHDHAALRALHVRSGVAISTWTRPVRATWRCAGGTRHRRRCRQSPIQYSI